MKTKRQKLRRLITFGLFLIMPLIMKFFSPIMAFRTAMIGVVSASIITILLMFLVGMFTGRLWCGWLCPAGGVQDVVSDIGNVKKTNNKMRVIKYILAIAQIISIILFLTLNENTRFDYFYAISPNVTGLDWIFYYIMVFMFVGLPFIFGKRSYCNHLCVIAPIMTLGKKTGEKIGIKHKRITYESGCIDCKVCNKNCPVSIDVSEQIKDGKVKHNDCIACLVCVDTCPKKVLEYKSTKNQ